jgi:hypothetical protein
VALEPHKNLQLYISATSNMVSMAIIIECGESDTNSKIQYLVYFISEVLSDSKAQYFHITSRKFSHYFEVHQIEVLTSSTLGEILNNREVIRKIAKWALSCSCTTLSTSQRQRSRLKH